jgi:hypothetical protein
MQHWGYGIMDNTFFTDSSLVNWMMALTYGAVALWISRWRKPVHFFTGGEVKPEEITDIRTYNRANGKMWATYSAICAVAGLVGLLSNIAGFILFGLLIFPGFVVLFRFHKRIFNKYKILGKTVSY